METPFYVYRHLDPRDHQVRYIGKGSGRRAWIFGQRYGHHRNWIRSLKNLGLIPVVEIVEYFESEVEAFKTEGKLIKTTREAGTKLCNTTDGGEGAAGMTWEALYGEEGAKERKRKLAERNRRNAPKISETITKRNKQTAGKTREKLYGPQKAAAMAAAQSARNSGNGNPMYGRRREDLVQRNRRGRGKKKPKEKREEDPRGKAVVHLESGTTYPSLRLASEALGVSRVYIRDVIAKARTNTLGMNFRWTLQGT